MEDDTSPPPSERPSSPASWVSPGLAIDAVPQLDRSVSTASSVSSVSGRSSNRLSDSGGRRGYMRPQATVFSASAKNRESVMNLGTIAHLQYYFARTGLLDGKGAQLAKARKNGIRTASGTEIPGSQVTEAMAYLTLNSENAGATLADDSSSQIGEGLVESPIDESGEPTWEEYQEPVMLPPTVSTYKQTPVYVPPPPDMTILRRELRESLDEAQKHLQEVENGFASATGNPENNGISDAPGWHEIQGLNLLDVVTLAIRAAKNYYTAHENTQRLYSIKSERVIRSELYQVLDVLKRLAVRNFAGGVQSHEASSLMSWVVGISKLLDTEEEKEREERKRFESWSWREGDWTGKEREREWRFLQSFDPDPEPLPEWTEPKEGELPTPFLQTLQNGLRLVHLHNALVKNSKRQFEEIKTFHTDTQKPYRCAENLRYWIKSAELRWDIKLNVDVMGVVYGTDSAAWRKFDEAILKWCRGVRDELIEEMRQRSSPTKTPTLQIDPSYEDAAASVAVAVA